MKLIHSNTIDKPATAVFDHLVEPSLLKRWQPRVSSAVYRYDGNVTPPRKGAQLDCTCDGTPLTATITEYTRPHLYAADFRTGIFDYAASWRMDEVAGRTHVTAETRLNPGGAIKGLSYLVLFPVLWCMHLLSLSRLKKAVLTYDPERVDKGEDFPARGQYRYVAGGRGLLLRKQWRQKKTPLFFLFIALWLGLGLLLFPDIPGEAAFQSTGHVIFFCVWSIFLAALGYVTCAQYLNTTEISITSECVEVAHSPLPWLGQRKVNPATIRSLYVKREYSTDKHGNMHFRYRVNYRDTAGEERRLLGAFRNEQEAKWLKAQLEQVLG